MPEFTDEPHEKLVSSVKMGLLRMNLTKRINNEKLPEIPEPQQTVYRD